jgi:CarD family transcriptional regulator
MPVGGLLLKIPVSNSQTIGVRPIMSRDEAEALVAAIPEMEVENNANWNKRYRENMARMKSGDLYEVSRVVKALMHRDKQRGLSNGERKMLHNARQILISEIVMAEEAEYSVLEKLVDKAMMQTPASESH